MDTNSSVIKSKSVAIMQPYFFPYIGYFQLINAVDTFVIYDDVNYINKGYINRNSILLNGSPHKLTLALCGASQNKLINEIFIGNNTQKLLKTIQMAYSKAPQFETAFDMICNLLRQKERNLAKFTGESIQRISEYIELKTKFIYSSDIEKDNSLKATHKIISICKKLNSNHYINAIGGEKLYNKLDFSEQNIKLSFVRPQVQIYPQFENVFAPNLSIIDILMFNSKEHITTMLAEYKLI